MKFGIGQSVSRVEDNRFLTGAGRFLDDLAPSEIDSGAGRAPLIGHVLRSPVAHGRITRLDVAPARTMAGVAAVYTHADIAARLAPIVCGMPVQAPDGTPAHRTEQPRLADDTVRFVGQPVAWIVAETAAIAADAAEAIELDIDELPAITDASAAGAEDAPQLHPHIPANRVYHWAMGDRAAADAAFAEADHVTRIAVANQRVIVNALEPRGIVVRHDADGMWEVWIGSQGSFAARRQLAQALAVEPERIRVRTVDVGGGFGMKLMDHPEYALAALAAQDLGRPVKWIASRSEGFLSDCQGRDLMTEAEGAFRADGRLLGLRWCSVSNLGAYSSSAGNAVHTLFSGNLIGGVYDVRAVYHEVEGMVTNTTPTDAYRGAGRPEVLHVMERLMGAASRELDLDPLEIRRRNLIRPDQIPYKTAGGITFDSLAAQATLEKAAELAEASALPQRRAQAEAVGDLLGLGVAYYFERTGGGPVETAKIVLNGEGQAEIFVGTQSTGQGHETAWAQIVHEKLGLPFERIALQAGDTWALPAGGGTGGSRSLLQAGRVLLQASDDIVAQGLEAAADLLEVAPADVQFEPADGGRYRIAGTDRTVALTHVVEKQGGLIGVGDVNDTIVTTPNGCHIAEVRIDPETGLTQLVRYVVVDDFGAMVNPRLVAGQVMGGVAQGVGQILGEAAIWDAATGQPLTGSFMDYQMPRAADLPFIEVTFNPVPTPSNPLGVKGCGEAGCVGALPAVSLAVLDALASRGITELQPPYTPGRVWQALHAA
ncbi:MAG: xanthine dehydrogenase family protein molybdopterin-binding subunit [Pseudomonadota bacterium]